MRGEVCIGAASFLSLVSLILLIFVHVGQIDTQTVPRGVSMAKVNTSGYGAGLSGAFLDPINGLYTDNASAPLGARAGLRDAYKFGMYSHCAYVDSHHGGCTNHSIAAHYKPYDAITSDMFANYSQFTDAIILGTSFRSTTLGSYTAAAYYLILLGTICTALAFLLGVLRHTYTFLFSTLFAILGSVLLLIGAAIWTAMVNSSKDINSFVVGTNNPVPLGITVSTGEGIYLLWASFALLVVSVLPYMISCCTYRG